VARHLHTNFRMRQLSLPQKRHAFRKTARAISTRGSNHVTLRANAFVLRRHHVAIRKILAEMQRRYGMRLNAIAIMGNHLHLSVRVPGRKAFADSMRLLTGRIARTIGRGKLWSSRCWSRPVTSRRDFRAVLDYISRNPFREGIFNGEVDSFFIQGGLLQDAPAEERARDEDLRVGPEPGQMSLGLIGTGLA